MKKEKLLQFTLPLAIGLIAALPSCANHRQIPSATEPGGRSPIGHPTPTNEPETHCHDKLKMNPFYPSRNTATALALGSGIYAASRVGGWHATGSAVLALDLAKLAMEESPSKPLTYASKNEMALLSQHFATKCDKRIRSLKVEIAASKTEAPLSKATFPKNGWQTPTGISDASVERDLAANYIETYL